MTTVELPKYRRVLSKNPQINTVYVYRGPLDPSLWITLSDYPQVTTLVLSRSVGPTGITGILSTRHVCHVVYDEDVKQIPQIDQHVRRNYERRQRQQLSHDLFEVEPLNKHYQLGPDVDHNTLTTLMVLTTITNEEFPPELMRLIVSHYVSLYDNEGVEEVVVVE